MILLLLLLVGCAHQPAPWRVCHTGLTYLRNEGDAKPEYLAYCVDEDKWIIFNSEVKPSEVVYFTEYYENDDQRIRGYVDRRVGIGPDGQRYAIEPENPLGN